MSYIIKSDFSYFFRERKKYLFIIIFVLALYPFAEKFIYHLKSIPIEYWREKKMSELLLGNVGATYLNGGIASISFYIPFALYTFLNFQTISCYFNHLKYGAENVFLRITKGKWLCCKYISIGLYTVAFQLIVYLTLIIIYYILDLKPDLLNIANIYVYDTIVKIFFGYIAVTLMSLFNKYGVSIMYLLILLAIVNIRMLKFGVLDFLYYLFASEYLVGGGIICLLCVFIFLTILTYIVNRRIITKIFEREVFI